MTADAAGQPRPRRWHRRAKADAGAQGDQGANEQQRARQPLSRPHRRGPPGIARGGFAHGCQLACRRTDGGDGIIVGGDRVVVRVDLHHACRWHRRREPCRLRGGQDEPEPRHDLAPGAQHQCRHGDRVAFSPDGKLLAIACADGTIRLWNPVAGQPAAAPIQVTTPLNGVHGVAFSPDGTTTPSANRSRRSAPKPRKCCITKKVSGRPGCGAAKEPPRGAGCAPVRPGSARSADERVWMMACCKLLANRAFKLAAPASSGGGTRRAQTAGATERPVRVRRVGHPVDRDRRADRRLFARSVLIRPSH